jgi:hypothetical protein
MPASSCPSFDRSEEKDKIECEKRKRKAQPLPEYQDKLLLVVREISSPLVAIHIGAYQVRHGFY